MDIQESLLTAVYTLLTEDSTLQSRMGGTVRLYPIMAVPDAEFPYLVHKIDMTNPDYNPVVRCTYVLDIWSYSPSAEEVLDIKERVEALLEDLDSSTDETSDFWMWLQTHGFVAESSEGIWHYTCQFNLRYVRDAQIGVLLKR